MMKGCTNDNNIQKKKECKAINLKNGIKCKNPTDEGKIYCNRSHDGKVCTTCHSMPYKSQYEGQKWTWCKCTKQPATVLTQGKQEDPPKTLPTTCVQSKKSTTKSTFLGFFTATQQKPVEYPLKSLSGKLDTFYVALTMYLFMICHVTSNWLSESEKTSLSFAWITWLVTFVQSLLQKFSPESQNDEKELSPQEIQNQKLMEDVTKEIFLAEMSRLEKYISSEANNNTALRRYQDVIKKIIPRDKDFNLLKYDVAKCHINQWRANIPAVAKGQAQWNDTLIDEMINGARAQHTSQFDADRFQKIQAAIEKDKRNRKVIMAVALLLMIVCCIVFWSTIDPAHFSASENPNPGQSPMSQAGLALTDANDTTDSLVRKNTDAQDTPVYLSWDNVNQTIQLVSSITVYCGNWLDNSSYFYRKLLNNETYPLPPNNNAAQASTADHSAENTSQPASTSPQVGQDNSSLLRNQTNSSSVNTSSTGSAMTVKGEGWAQWLLGIFQNEATERLPNGLNGTEATSEMASNATQASEDPPNDTLSTFPQSVQDNVASTSNDMAHLFGQDNSSNTNASSVNTASDNATLTIDPNATVVNGSWAWEKVLSSLQWVVSGQASNETEVIDKPPNATVVNGSDHMAGIGLMPVTVQGANMGSMSYSGKVSVGE